MSSKLEGNLQVTAFHLNTSPETLVVSQTDDQFGLSETMQIGVSYRRSQRIKSIQHLHLMI